MKNVVFEFFSTGIGTVRAIYSNFSPDEDNLIVTDAELPEREDIPGMNAYLRIVLDTGELYYDYVAHETLDKKVSDLQQENAELRQAIIELTMMMAMPQ
ncbi:hypothetical protein JCM10914A_55670 [Paenibacillus sp. JCM 10914]